MNNSWIYLTAKGVFTTTAFQQTWKLINHKFGHVSLLYIIWVIFNNDINSVNHIIQGGRLVDITFYKPYEISIAFSTFFIMKSIPLGNEFSVTP